MNDSFTAEDVVLAKQILEEIKKADSILLHCHPAPDPDSVGSSLAMYHALKQLGKKVTIIKGDSEIPAGFRHFPGASEIVEKNYLDIDSSKYDLFLILDCARIEMVSRRGEVKFPPNMKTIVIDHHLSNSRFGNMNLVKEKYPAAAQLLYDLFTEWGIKMTPEIASNIFIGMYSDTGGFKYYGVSSATYKIASELVKIIPSVPELIGKMENSNSKEFIAFEAAALQKIKEYFGIVAISALSQEELKNINIQTKEVRTSEVASYMLTVSEWEITASAVEIEPGLIKFSFRSKDGEKYNVAELTGLLGGGGHKSAAGLIMKMPLADAITKVVETIANKYNFK